MDEFPKYITPDNKDSFNQINFERNMSYARKNITELILKGNENDYFNITNFCNTFKLSENEKSDMIKIISLELKELGWNVKTSFADTGLFIYSTEKPPPSCYDDEF